MRVFEHCGACPAPCGGGTVTRSMRRVANATLLQFDRLRRCAIMRHRWTPSFLQVSMTSIDSISVPQLVRSSFARPTVMTAIPRTLGFVGLGNMVSPAENSRDSVVQSHHSLLRAALHFPTSLPATCAHAPDPPERLCTDWPHATPCREVAWRKICSRRAIVWLSTTQCHRR
jgi:hypothetical protein